MAYVLINSDNTINFIGDALTNLNTANKLVLTIPHKTVEQILNGIEPIYTAWDPVNEVAVDYRHHPHLLHYHSDPVKNAQAKKKHCLRIASWYLKDREDSQAKEYYDAIMAIEDQPGYPEEVVWPPLPQVLRQP